MVAPFGTHAPDKKLTRLIEKARLWSFKPGLKYPSSYCRRRALDLIKDRPVDYEFRGGRARFFPNGNTAEKRALLNPARFDPIELDFISSSLGSGGVFLDIGANVGLFSIVAAGAAGPSGTVLAFEPNPSVFVRLSTNVMFNQNEDVANILPLQVAVTSSEGEVSFLEPERNLGEGRVISEGEARDGPVIRVEGKPLTLLLDEHGVGHVDMIKIDVEGHEMAALEPFFRSGRADLFPTHVIIERGSPEHWAPLDTLFRSVGYESLVSTPMNEILELRVPSVEGYSAN
ncbi:MAG: FkbM family methyltransferase [Alphaproteobacteria bacterium]|nr:MAG: FkbM family methyltransferase [Alphaproteobacteria bacterium]